jgi:tetratricopeptide (TPR) repeat protein
MNETIARDERDVRSYLIAGSLALFDGDLDAANALFDHALLLDPYAPAALLGKGNIAHRRGEFDIAVSWYERALAIAPDDDVTKSLLEEARKGRLPGNSP